VNSKWRVFRVVRPVATVRFWVEPYPDPAREFGPVAMTIQGGSQISTVRENLACGSAVLPMLSKALEIELFDIEAEDVTLKSDYLWQVVEIVIGGVPMVVEVRFLWLFMSLSRILMQGSVSTNLLDPMRHQVDLRKVEVGI